MQTLSILLCSSYSGSHMSIHPSQAMLAACNYHIILKDQLGTEIRVTHFVENLLPYSIATLLKSDKWNTRGHNNARVTNRFTTFVFCELLGSIILSACLVWGFVASLALIQLIHNHGKVNIRKQRTTMFSDTKQLLSRLL